MPIHPVVKMQMPGGDPPVASVVTVVGRVFAYGRTIYQGYRANQQRPGETIDEFLKRLNDETQKLKDKLRVDEGWIDRVQELADEAAGDGSVRVRLLPMYLADP